MGFKIRNKFLTRTTHECGAVKLTWTSDKPVWVDQWLLPIDKLTALETLVNEQLLKGCTVPTNSRIPSYLLFRNLTVINGDCSKI